MAWKAVGRMVCYLKTCSSHVLMACPAITSMCAAMRQQSNECASCGVRREKRVSTSLVFLCPLAYSLSSLYWLLLFYLYTHTFTLPHFAFHLGSTRPVCQVVEIMSFLCYADHQSSSGTCRRSAFLVILCLWWFLFSVCRSLNHVTITLHSACWTSCWGLSSKFLISNSTISTTTHFPPPPSPPPAPPPAPYMMMN